MGEVNKAVLGVEISTDLVVEKQGNVVFPVVVTSVYPDGNVDTPILVNSVNLVDLMQVWVKENIEMSGGGLSLEDKKNMLATLKSVEDTVKDMVSLVVKTKVVTASTSSAQAPNSESVSKVENTSNVEKPPVRVTKKETGIKHYTLSSLGGEAKKIGFFGVTANPPHVGHCEVIREALKRCDEVWVSPVYIHPHGKETIPYQHRLALLELILEDFFTVEELRRIRLVEIDKEYAELNKKIPYSYDLLDYLRKSLPKHSYALVIGEDNFKPNVWQKFYKHNEIEEEFSLIVTEDKGVHSTQIRQNFTSLTEDALAMFCLPQATAYLKKHRFWV